ncbi:uncharacterized protein METZ01_LOCUS343407 [marine metagenome]|uniref:Uncharacterized protein n=1 Tax=marine metagenome TaxID=408172 RepID=A0A382QYI0_9ZZZZ
MFLFPETGDIPCNSISHGYTVHICQFINNCLVMVKIISEPIWMAPDQFYCHAFDVSRSDPTHTCASLLGSIYNLSQKTLK